MSPMAWPDAGERVGAAMDIGRKLATAANLALLTAHAAAARLLPPAEFSVGPDPLPRLDAVWLPEAVALGSVHIPHNRLRAAGRFFDTRSFAQLLRGCRRARAGSRVGSG